MLNSLMLEKTENHLIQKTPQLTDLYGRKISYLRLSVTDCCNLNCSYCNPTGNRKWLPHNEVLSYEEIITMTRLLVDVGVTKVRITGGEPLVRQNLVYLIRELKKIKGLREVAMTTNGILLAGIAAELKASGLDRINISVDTLNPDTFESITGHRQLNAVLEGVDAAIAAGLKPVKINVVPMAGVNDQELTLLATYFLEKGLSVRFIEQMPIGGQRSDIIGFVSFVELIKKLEAEVGLMTELIRDNGDGPARRYRVKGYKGELGFITAMSNHFCKKCNRLRLTADGNLRPCLMDDRSIDIKTLLRCHANDALLSQAITRAVKLKPEAHLAHPSVKTGMVAIGG